MKKLGVSAVSVLELLVPEFALPQDCPCPSPADLKFEITLPEEAAAKIAELGLSVPVVGRV